MPRLEIRVALGITVVAVVAWGLTRVPPLLAGMETFRVSETQVEGRRYLTQAQVVEIAGIPADASVWDDFDDWEDRLREHPVILEASVDRVLPGTLIVRIREREAVALVAMPTLEPVDREGRRLPVDPALVSMDLPIIRLAQDPIQQGRPPSAARIRPLARAAERMQAEATFWSRTSDMTITRDGVEARWGSPAVLFRLPLEVDPYRLREAVAVLRHALAADSARPPRTVDLRYQDQIVVRYRGS